MRNLRLQIAYNGSSYHGYQVQSNALSVAEVLQDGIERVLGHREDIIGCSRTDTGVHAACYYLNFHTDNPIPEERLAGALNDALPEDICVHECKEVPAEFHARYSCTGKQYLYRIWNAPVRDPFRKGLVLHYPFLIDVEKLKPACEAFTGRHDFRSFCAAGGKDTDTVREVYRCTMEQQGNEYLFRVSGNGFLYHMVRIMVGTLLEINEGRIPADAVPEILRAKDRACAGRTAKACGLYLERVDYE